MQTTSLTMELPDSQHYDLGTRWQYVREYSVPLAVFGAVLTSALPVLTIGGNTLLFIVIMKFQELRHVPSNLLLASLAVCDLLIGLLAQPLYAVSSVCVLTRENCSLILPTSHVYVSVLLAHLSFLSVTLITIDRYICIVKPLRYLTIVTRTRALKAIMFSWMISAILSVMLFILTKTVMTVFQITMIFSILFVIIFCYVKIFRISQHHRRNIISQVKALTQGPTEQEFQSAKTVFLVVDAVLLGFIPITANQTLLNLSSVNAQVKIFRPFAVTFFLLNSSLNPLIFSFRSRKLRRFLKKLFKRDA